MFQKGDKVVYPHHGAGIIEEIKKQKVFSETKQYYILKLTVGQLVINVPVENCHELGLRSIISKREANKVMSVLADKCNRLSDDANKRFKHQNDKIASGNIYSLAEVIRDLSKRQKISTREKRLLAKAKEILVSELMFTFHKTEKEILEKIDSILN